MDRDPDSLAAREVLDAIIKAGCEGTVSQDAVSWAASKAYEQFRKEAKAMAIAERERRESIQAERAMRERRTFWSRIWN
jgi:aminoglycoside phosphotransferase (APT) family kinase protein